MGDPSSSVRDFRQRPAGRLSALAGRWLRLQPGEGVLVLLIGAAYFLVFGGSVIGRNARDALFIKNFGVANLPYMYVASALLVVASAMLYSALVERVDRRRLLNLSFVVFCGLLGACRLALVGEPRWFYPVLYVVCQAVSIVSGMVFWTATGELFDTRQAKRLLPIVGVGGLLSMIACGFMTRPLVRLLGSANLFLVWAVMLVLTLLLLYAALRRARGVAGNPELSLRVAVAAKPGGRPGWLDTLTHGFREMRSTRLLRAMGVIALANTVVFVLVDFQFSRVMNDSYRTPDELTSFLGTFRGISGILGLLIQLLGTPWLLANVGVGATIAIEPSLMLLSTLGMATSLNYGTAFTARFIDNTLFCTVQSSSFELLYNPLPLERRPRLRAFVEGCFRPLMSGVCGLLLVAGARILSPRQISICAAAAACVWVAASLRVRRGYIEALVENLGAGSVAQRLSAADTLAKMKGSESLARLTNAIRTAPPESAVPAILLLERFGRPESQDVLVDLLAHPQAQIRATAVAALGRLGNRALVAHLNQLLQDPDPRTRANAVEACVLADTHALRSDLQLRLEDSADRVRANAMAVLMRLEEVPATELLPEVEQMARSEDPNRRASAAYALAWFPGEMAQPLLLKLLEDPAPQPRLRALRSLEQVGSAESVPLLLQVISRVKTFRREGRRTLLAIAAREPHAVFERVVAAINSRPKHSQPNGVVRLSAHVLGRLNRIDALPHLVEVLAKEDLANREEALKAIERLAEQHPVPEPSRAPLEAFAFAELERLEENLARRNALLALRTDLPEAGSRRVTGAATDDEARRWLADEMLGENRWMRRRVLRTAALLYDAARVREVARGVDDRDSRRRANALEALEYVVPGGLGQRLAHNIESEAQQDVPSDAQLDQVLPDLIRHRFSTVRAAAVLLLGGGRFPEYLPLVENSLRDPAPMVREIAVRAVWRLLGNQAVTRLAPMAQDTDPRVRRSVEMVLRDANAHLRSGGPPEEVSMLLTVEKVLFLKSVPLFSSLEGEQLASLAEIAEEMEVEAGRTIFEERTAGDELYVVVKGRLKVHRGQPGSEVVLAELGERECFGEMALLDSEPRSASVTTLEPCRLLKIRAEDFRELLFERPQTSLEILKIMARRLRRMDVEMEERLRFDSVQQYM